MAANNKQDFAETYNLGKNKSLKKRYDITLDFLKNNLPQNSKILDLGIENPFSDHMRNNGFDVVNTAMNVDLDLDYEVVKSVDFDVVSAFEIFEHMVAPFNLLRAIKAKKLVASVPLSLWFSKSYWSSNDPWDRHYHEFEPRQFDMLLEKSGWRIVKSKKWKSYSGKIGIRPILRRFYDRYYIVYCERI